MTWWERIKKEEEAFLPECYSFPTTESTIVRANKLLKNVVGGEPGGVKGRDRVKSSPKKLKDEFKIKKTNPTKTQTNQQNVTEQRE